MRLPWPPPAPPKSCTAPSWSGAPPGSSAPSRSPSTRFDRLSLDSTASVPPDTPLLGAHAPYHDKDALSPPRRSTASPPPRSSRRAYTAVDLSPPSPGATGPSSPRSYASTLRAHRRQHRVASLAYSSAVACLAASCLLAAAVLGWTAHFLYTRHAALATAVFAPPLQPRPVAVEARAPPFPPPAAATDHQGAHDLVARAAAIEDELGARFAALGLPDTRALQCPDVAASPALTARYAPLRSAAASDAAGGEGATLLALNLYNSEHVVPALAHALLRTAALLGPSSVHISIFENGSTDRTVPALAHLARALSALGASHDVVSDPRRTNWRAVDRIDQLAVYRNEALAPLARANATHFSDIVFVNDVFACPGDVLELLFQRRAQSADAACAMDWRANKGIGRWWRDSVVYYDSWVGRTLSGQMLRPRADVFQEWHDGLDGLFNGQGDGESKKRFMRGLPTPVYSCWNGMLALDARPFTSTAIAPRYDPSSALSPAERKSWRRLAPVRAAEPARFRTALNREGECAASECKTLAKDFWTRGFDRWLVVPSVRVTYDAAVYAHPRLQQLAVLSPPALSNLTLPPPPPPSDVVSPAEPAELIPWATLSPPESVVCWAWVRGFHLDFEWIRATWYRPYAFARTVIERAARRA
ncbi:hypothetical protein JCM10449v2_004659 [Rhodotorula kratochvilovae]